MWLDQVMEAACGSSMKEIELDILYHNWERNWSCLRMGLSASMSFSQGWLCTPSYVVTTTLVSLASRCTCFFTVHVWWVHR